jgi:hypothetical protein
MLPVAAMGIFLAFYLPAVPFIKWILGLASWLILVIETMFAAPLWAIGHAMPEGEGFAGQHGRTGYMMLLGVLVRPPLMVAGLLCAMVCLPLFGKFLGASFLIFHSSMTSGNTIYGPAAIVAFLFLGGTLFVMVTQKLFSLITWLPENVTKWIGQQVASLGEAHDEAQNKAMFMAAASGMGGGVGAAVGGARSALAAARGGGGGGRPQATMSQLMPDMGGPGPGGGGSGGSPGPGGGGSGSGGGGRGPWFKQSGGAGALSQRQKAQAQKSFESWSETELGQNYLRHPENQGFQGYVQYAQEQQQKREESEQ